MITVEVIKLKWHSLILRLIYIKCFSYNSGVFLTIILKQRFEFWRTNINFINLTTINDIFCNYWLQTVIYSFSLQLICVNKLKFRV